MSRIGFFTLSHTGHLFPAIALGRKLSQRGHEVIFFNSIISKAVLRNAGLALHPLSLGENYQKPPGKYLGSNLSFRLQRQQLFTQALFKEAPGPIQSAAIDALVLDQMFYPVGTVADWLNIPFVNLSLVSPIFISARTPMI